MKIKKPFWRYRQKAAIAKKFGIKQQHLYEILYRKRGVSEKRAKALEKVCNKVLDKDQKKIGWFTWYSNRTTEHPAFYNRPTYNHL